MRRTPCRAWGARRPQHALRQGGPVQRLPTRPGAGAFRGGAGAPQVAVVDTTAQPKERDAPRGQALPLWLTEPGPLSQDVVDKYPKPCTRASGRGL